MSTLPPKSAKPAEVVTPDAILQLGFGFWASKTLLTAVELGVFTALAKRSATAEELAQELGLNGRGARDFFDALVALEILQREDGRYLNTPAAARFLNRHQPTYIGALLEMANTRLYGFWGSLTTALRTGTPQNEARDNPNHFEEIYRDPVRLHNFASAMTGVSAGAAHVLAEKFDWGRVTSFVDAGCAQGAVPLVLAQRHPHLRGIGFDLPAIEPIFSDFTRAVGERVRFHGGDLFKDPLPQADVVIYGHMLHGWDEPTKRQLLRLAYDALPVGGQVVVYDEIIDDDRRQNAFGLLMSLNMLIETSGGFDYTGAEAKRWLSDTGFRDLHQEHLAGPTSMLVGTK